MKAKVETKANNKVKNPHLKKDEGLIKPKEKKDSKKKKRVKKGTVIFLSNVPHGFFENEMKEFFSQFGEVCQARHVRSKKTGRSCGYGYVEFQYPEVAKVVAKSMDGYLTFGKIMKCQVVPPGRTTKKLFMGDNITAHDYPALRRRKKALEKLNSLRSASEENRRLKRLGVSYEKKSTVFKKYGIELDLMQTLKSTVQDERKKVREKLEREMAEGSKEETGKKSQPEKLDKANEELVSKVNLSPPRKGKKKQVKRLRKTLKQKNMKQKNLGSKQKKKETLKPTTKNEDEDNKGEDTKLPEENMEKENKSETLKVIDDVSSEPNTSISSVKEEKLKRKGTTLKKKNVKQKKLGIARTKTIISKPSEMSNTTSSSPGEKKRLKRKGAAQKKKSMKQKK